VWRRRHGCGQERRAPSRQIRILDQSPHALESFTSRSRLPWISQRAVTLFAHRVQPSACLPRGCRTTVMFDESGIDVACLARGPGQQKRVHGLRRCRRALAACVTYHLSGVVAKVTTMAAVTTSSYALRPVSSLVIDLSVIGDACVWQSQARHERGREQGAPAGRAIVLPRSAYADRAYTYLQAHCEYLPLRVR
jgi:hypothetical protein